MDRPFQVRIFNHEQWLEAKTIRTRVRMFSTLQEALDASNTTQTDNEDQAWQAPTRSTDEFGVHELEVQGEQPGILMVDIQADGEFVDDSPIFIRLTAPECKGKHEVSDARGQCTCQDGTTRMYGGCRPSWRVALEVTGGCLGGLLIFLALGYVILEHRADRSWRIKPADVLFGNPPDIIGQTDTKDPVYRAEWRNLEVAVKILRPELIYSPNEKEQPKQDMATSGAFRRLMGGNAKFATAPSRLDQRTKSEALSHSSDNTFQVSEQGRHKEYFANVELRHRMRTLVKLRHPNCVEIFGLAQSPLQPMMLVMEYMENKSLSNLLHDTGIHFEVESLLSMLRDVVDGMVFLHGHDPIIFHGHLSSNNILVDSNFRCKISDWLGVCTTKCMVKQGDPFLAPEAYEGILTPCSDVYSFAIVAKECFTREKPSRIDTRHAREIIDFNQNKSNRGRLGARQHSLSVNMPENVQSIFLDCSAPNPGDRPAFAQLRGRLKTFHKKGLMSAFVRRVEEGRKRDKVLEQVFPKHIAAALKAGIKPEIETRRDVSYSGLRWC
jgi:serine/threonine protein kinase